MNNISIILLGIVSIALMVIIAQLLAINTVM